jgi:predicted acylesterase/phospholipase RssA
MELDPSNISNIYVSNQINNNNTTDIWEPDVIVLGPGGAKGYLELGLMQAFEQENYATNTKIRLGCSIGSAISLLMVCDYCVKDIYNDCIGINIINDITDINIDHFTDSPGLLNIRSVENLLKLRVSQKFGLIPTLKQLYMFTGVSLELMTFNLDKYRPELQTKDTAPDLSCVEAVMMSMAIPVLLRPRIYRGNVYVDGAIGDPYPILVHDDGEKKILGVYIDSEHSSHASDKKIARYLYRCAQASMKVLRDKAIENASDNCKHIALKTPVLDTTGLSLDKKAKQAMFESGYKAGMIFINRIRNPEKYKLILDENEEIPTVDDISSDTDGVLDADTIQMIDMLSNDNYMNEHHISFKDSDEDIFLSDIEESDEDTLLIPITPDIRRNMERIYSDTQIDQSSFDINIT